MKNNQEISSPRRAGVVAGGAAWDEGTAPFHSALLLYERALHLIAAPQRPDGTWNRDREACRLIAQEALDDAWANRVGKEAEIERVPPCPTQTVGRKGKAAGSIRALELQRANRSRESQMLRESLRLLWGVAAARGEKPTAKQLQWRIDQAGSVGDQYLRLAGYPSLRSVQRHLKAIHQEPSPVPSPPGA